MTPVLVTSANGANGDGYGAILGFSADGSLIGPFSRDRRITDPRGISHDQSGELVYVNSGDDRVLALDRRRSCSRLGEDRRPRPRRSSVRSGRPLLRQATATPDDPCPPASAQPHREAILPDGIVPFTRGFGFGPDGDLYLASGVGPSGEGDNTTAVFDRRGALRTPRLVDDPELSPLDLVIAPNGNIVVSSEWPFGARHATSSVREYDHSTGAVARVFAPDVAIGFARPRGLRFGSDRHLYCVGKITLLPSTSSQGPTAASPSDSRDSTVRLLFYGMGGLKPKESGGAKKSG